MWRLETLIYATESRQNRVCKQIVFLDCVVKWCRERVFRYRCGICISNFLSSLAGEFLSRSN